MFGGSMRRLLVVALFALCFSFVGVTASHASPITVTIPDPGGPPGYISFGTGYASVTYSGVVFSQSGALSDGTLFNVGIQWSGYPAVLSSQGQSFGVANILISLPLAVS